MVKEWTKEEKKETITGTRWKGERRGREGCKAKTGRSSASLWMSCRKRGGKKVFVGKKQWKAYARERRSTPESPWSLSSRWPLGTKHVPAPDWPIVVVTADEELDEVAKDAENSGVVNCLQAWTRFARSDSEMRFRGLRQNTDLIISFSSAEIGRIVCKKSLFRI